MQDTHEVQSGAKQILLGVIFTEILFLFHDVLLLPRCCFYLVSLAVGRDVPVHEPLWVCVSHSAPRAPGHSQHRPEQKLKAAPLA